ncbi:hypothetical protein Y032_0062g3367 [Ancylostoma ceylanicum]|uniref:Uncharacterized protein n=1 Tax=Ancylostoma ceylanicum TaxID=53326 RepID=A0A016U2D2_9BILA|nr:hypothetical protein Y032_0062g3367 [Ancylostoma ceylanicum]
MSQLPVTRSAHLPWPFGRFWPATKEGERRLSVMETKMPRWMAGITRVDRIRYEKICEPFGIAPIADKLRETRLDGTATFCAPTKTPSAK